MSGLIRGWVYRHTSVGVIVEIIHEIGPTARVLFAGRTGEHYKNEYKLFDELIVADPEAYEELAPSVEVFKESIAAAVLSSPSGRTIGGVVMNASIPIVHNRTLEDRMTLMCRAEKAWGQDSQILVAIEEMAELTHALLQIIRRGIDEKTHRNVIEEMADVRVMLAQMAYIFDAYYPYDGSPTNTIDLKAVEDRKWAMLAQRLDGVIE